ncbi:MAG: hypothetical protein V4773_15990 [Verrucomicrobiota bacterium]
MKHLLRLGLLTALLYSASCQKQPEAKAPAPAAASAPKPATVAVVKDAERSKNFEAVNRQLELGGTLYGYVDIEGDVAELMKQMQTVLAEMAKNDRNFAMGAKLDLADLATTLGLTGMKAVGVSSVPDGSGFYRNRAFFYDKGERQGLMAALGGKSAPFKHLGLAPADTAFYWESEMDIGMAYKTIKAVVEKVAGEPVGTQMETALKAAGDAVTLKVLDLIYGLKGRSAIVLRLDPERTMVVRTQQAVVLPQVGFLLCVEGVGQIVEPSLAQLPILKRSDEGSLHIYELTEAPPVTTIKPALVIDGNMLFLTSSVAFMKECREQKTGGLGQTAEFKKALEQVGTEGNGLTYVSPRFFEQIRRIETLNTDLPPQMQSMVQFMISQMKSADRPLVAVRTNLDDGILVRAYYNRSFKQELAMGAMYNPVSVGLLAAMAIPAFQKVRTSSQEKAITNNLRQLAAAADQHFLETGTTTATYNDIVGPTKYVKSIQSVMGENYRQMRFVQGQPLAVRLPDGRMIRYGP